MYHFHHTTMSDKQKKKDMLQKNIHMNNKQTKRKYREISLLFKLNFYQNHSHY